VNGTERRGWLPSSPAHPQHRPPAIPLSCGDEIITALAEVDGSLDGETSECVLCNAEIPFDATTWPLRSATPGAPPYGLLVHDHRAHRQGCPWRHAREVLGVPLNQVTRADREQFHLPEDLTEHRFLKDGHPLELDRLT
jgi:hypothetical protein